MQVGDLELGIPKLRAGSFFPILLERRRCIAGVMVGDSETEAFWAQFLRHVRETRTDRRPPGHLRQPQRPGHSDPQGHARGAWQRRPRRQCMSTFDSSGCKPRTADYGEWAQLAREQTSWA